MPDNSAPAANHAAKLSHWLEVASLIALSVCVSELLNRYQPWREVQLRIFGAMTEWGRTHVPPNAVAVVPIGDDEFWGEELAGRTPIRRDYLATLVRAIADHHPGVIALDLDLSRRNDAVAPDYPEYVEEVGELVRAIEEVSKRKIGIVLPRTLQRARRELEPTILSGVEISPRIAFGYLEVARDLRLLPLGVKSDQGAHYDSFSQATVRMMWPSSEELLHVGFGRFPYSDFHSDLAFDQVPAADLIRGPTPAQRDKLVNRIVLIGATWHERGVGRGPIVDQHLTPVGPIPGVFVHANYVQTLLGSREIDPVPHWVSIVIEIVGAIAIACVLSMAKRPLAKFAGVALTILGFVGANVFWLLTFGFYADALVPLLVLMAHPAVEKVIDWRARASVVAETPPLPPHGMTFRYGALVISLALATFALGSQRSPAITGIAGEPAGEVAGTGLNPGGRRVVNLVDQSDPLDIATRDAVVAALSTESERRQAAAGVAEQIASIAAAAVLRRSEASIQRERDRGRDASDIAFLGIGPGVARSTGRLLGLTVGVGAYPDPRLVLRFATRDARSVAEVLRSSTLARDKQVVELTDDQATPSRILREIGQMQKVGSRDDVAVIFLAGHAVRDKAGDGFFFLAGGPGPGPGADARLSASDISLAIRTLGVSVGTVVVILDTCHSGALAGGLNPSELATPLNAGGSLLVLSSTRPGERSIEYEDLGHGAFTYALLLGLQGHADHNGDSLITLVELAGFLSEVVPCMTDGLQHPFHSIRGVDRLGRADSPASRLATGVIGQALAPRVEACLARPTILAPKQGETVRASSGVTFISPGEGYVSVLLRPLNGSFYVQNDSQHVLARERVAVPLGFGTRGEFEIHVGLASSPGLLLKGETFPTRPARSESERQIRWMAPRGVECCKE